MARFGARISATCLGAGPAHQVSTFSSKPTVRPAVEQSSLRNGTNRITILRISLSWHTPSTWIPQLLLAELLKLTLPFISDANCEGRLQRARIFADRIRAVTLGSNPTTRISCQVSFCRCKINGLELVFNVVDLDFSAVDQSIGVEPLHRSRAMPKQSIS